MRNKFNIPARLFWVVLIICILPVLIVVPQLSADSNSGTNSGTGYLYYNIWLLFGIATTFITGTLCFVDYSVNKHLSTPVIGGALFSAGIYQTACLLFTIDSPQAVIDAFAYQKWFISRSLFLLLLISSTSLLLLINKKHTKDPVKRQLTLLLALTGVLFALISALTVTFLFKTPYALTKRLGAINYPYESIVLAGFLLAGFLILPKFAKTFPSIFSRLLILSVVPAVFASFFMALHQQPYDIFFNSAFFLRFVHYSVPLLGIGLNYLQASKKEKKTVKRLHDEIRERIEIQQKLEKREALLANAEKIAHLGSWEYDLAENTVQCSDELLRILGLPSNYEPDINIHEKTVIEEDLDRVKREIAAAVRSQKSYQLEFRIRRPDGEIRTMLGQGHFSEDENKLINTVLDITEQKEATDKLLQSEALLRESEAIAQLGSWKWLPERNSFFWSDELYRIHGILPGEPEIDLRYYLSFIHQDDVQDFTTLLANTQKDLEPFSIEYRIIRPDGEIRHLLLNGKFKTDLYGNVLQVLGNTQDITEKKKTSLQLDRSESIYRTIAKNVPDSAVFLLDENRQLILSEGPALSKLEGSVFVTLENHEQFFEDALGGEAHQTEHQVNGKTFKTNYSPIYSSEGEVFAVMMVMHDISELKQAQFDLEGKIDELNRSNRDLEQFAYVASHDLQEPLRKIKAFGERLKLKHSSSLSEEGLDYLNRMRNASERMQNLIDDLLTLSKISRARDTMVPVNLLEIIKEVVYDLEYTIEQKRARIEVQASLVVEGIPSQLRQLFQNLLSNSLKFSRERVPLVIRINSEIVEAGMVSSLSFKPGMQYFKVEITDNGIGFEQEYSERIFKLFQRLHGRSEYEGNGIGLAVCKKIVENHSGFIEAESRLAEGSTFRIFLPITNYSE